LTNAYVQCSLTPQTNLSITVVRSTHQGLSSLGSRTPLRYDLLPVLRILLLANPELVKRAQR
jgi:hypothetical protein